MKAKLEQLYERIDRIKDKVNTEEATKTAFIMPFIQLLGYDIFNPEEVMPEYIADIGSKKGEKVDYVIMQDEIPAIIIECKHWKEDTDAHNSQLHRYYSNIKARFGIMTNGITYDFYTDLEEPNIMDSKPFLSINLSDLKDHSVKELEKFSKTTFDVDNILDSAEALKYIKAIRNEFEKEISSPSDDFVRMLVKRFYDRQINANRLETFRGYCKKAFSSYMTDTINARLKSALNINEESSNNEINEVIDEPKKEERKIVTTEEELEGFYIVKAILREKVSSDRIIFRDTQSYFGVLLDDNNRKPLCRLHFNTTNKYIELFHNGKDAPEKKILNAIDEIYDYKKELQQTINNYE